MRRDQKGRPTVRPKGKRCCYLLSDWTFGNPCSRCSRPDWRVGQDEVNAGRWKLRQDGQACSREPA
jgi:hypothetical protein